MKQLLSVLLLAVTLSGCADNETGLSNLPPNDQLFTVSLKLNGITQTLEPITKAATTLPDTIRLRVTMHVFDQTGTVITKEEKLLTETGGNIPVEFSVKKGIYDMAFWVDYVIYKDGKIASQAYGVDNMQAITINSGSGSSDAYSLAVKGVTVDGNTTVSQNTTLNRAVSMLKIESDKEVPSEIKKARYTVSKSATSLNVLTGETTITNTPVSYEDDLQAGTSLNVGRYLFPCDPFTCTVEMLDEVGDVVATVVVENVETESNSQTKLEGDFFDSGASVSFALNFPESWGTEKVYIIENPSTSFIDIPDAAFRAICLNRFDTNGDGKISKAEATQVTRMDIHDYESKILSLEGIEHFINIQELFFQSVQVGIPDLSKFKALTLLDLYKTKYVSFNLDNCPYLNRLTLTENPLLKSVNLSGGVALKYVRVESNPSLVEPLDLSHNTALEAIRLVSTVWKQADDLGKFVALKALTIDSSDLESLDVSKNAALEELYFYGNKLSSINLGNATALKNLSIGAPISSLDLSNATALEELSIGAPISSLDLSKATALKRLNIGAPISSLDLSKATALEYLSLGSNLRISSLDLSNATALKTLYINTPISSLDLSKAAALERLFLWNRSQIKSLDLTGAVALKELWLTTSAGRGDNDSQLSDLKTAQNLSLKKIVSKSNPLTALDLSGCPALENLQLMNAKMAGIDVSKNTALKTLECTGMPLTTLDVSKNRALEWFSCLDNPLLTTVYVFPNYTFRIEKSDNVQIEIKQ